MRRPRERGNRGKGGGGLVKDPNADPYTALDFVKPYHAPAVSHLGVENPGKTSEAFCSGTHRLETK